MQKYKIVLILIATGIVLFAGGGIAGYFFNDNAEIKIVEKTKIKTEYIIKNPTSEQLQVCFDSFIDIDATTDNDVLTATASDGCKKSIRSFKLLAKPKLKKHCIMLQYSGLYIDQMYHSFYSAGYYHRFGFLGIGGGGVFSRNETTKTMGGGLTVGVQLIF